MLISCFHHLWTQASVFKPTIWGTSKCSINKEARSHCHPIGETRWARTFPDSTWSLIPDQINNMTGNPYGTSLSATEGVSVALPFNRYSNIWDLFTNLQGKVVFCSGESQKNGGLKLKTSKWTKWLSKKHKLERKHKFISTQKKQKKKVYLTGFLNPDRLIF